MSFARKILAIPAHETRSSALEVISYLGPVSAAAGRCFCLLSLCARQSCLSPPPVHTHSVSLELKYHYVVGHLNSDISSHTHDVFSSAHETRSSALEVIPYLGPMSAGGRSCVPASSLSAPIHSGFASVHTSFLFPLRLCTPTRRSDCCYRT